MDNGFSNSVASEINEVKEKPQGVIRSCFIFKTEGLSIPKAGREGPWREFPRTMCGLKKELRKHPLAE
jgi:hypothetical protein